MLSNGSAAMNDGSAALDVAVIVVTWNSADHIEDFLTSLEAGLEGVANWELVVVDNDSHDETPDIVARMAPTARIIRSARNGGYASGINLGVGAAPNTRSYLVLNPDVRLRRGVAATLLEELETPGIGIAVPRLHRPDGRLLWSLRRAPTVWRLVGEAVLGGERAERVAGTGELIRDERVYERPGTADWATGAAMLVSADCMEEVGPWEESFFLYAEETDFCLRAGDRGYRLRYQPEAEAMHIGGQSHLSPALYSLLTVNRARAFRRRHGWAKSVLFWGTLVVGEALRSLRAGSRTHRAALWALLSRSRQRQLTGGNWSTAGPPSRSALPS